LSSHTKKKEEEKKKRKKIVRREQKIYSSEKRTQERPKMAQDWLRKFKNIKIEI